MISMKTTVRILLSGVLASLLFLCSCGKTDQAPAAGGTQASGDTKPVADTRPTAPAGEKMKTCFQCNGTGEIKCPDCRDGFVDCPGKCLKLDQGSWVHMQVSGHPATDVWQKFPKPGGGYTAYNQGHVGHVIVWTNGDWVDTGPCPVCHGKGKVECSKCQGTGIVLCTICDGKKVVPESWTSFDNPKLKNRPDSIALKDGRVLFGKKVFVFGSRTTIQTTNGSVEVNTSDILAANKSNVK
jgi:hypothetical protein